MNDITRVELSTELLGVVFVTNSHSFYFSVYEGQDNSSNFIGGFYVVSGKPIAYSYGRQFSEKELFDLYNGVLKNEILFKKMKAYFKRTLRKSKEAKTRLEKELDNVNEYLKWAETSPFI